MSSGARAARFEWTSAHTGDAVAVVAADHRVVRLISFSALAAYGTVRWATLLEPAPAARLAGILAVAVAVAVGVPAVARRSRILAALVSVGLGLAVFPIAGLPWEWAHHLRVAVSAQMIGTGLQRLPGALVPYHGSDHAVRLVVTLGAAVLLLDAAAVLALAGGGTERLSDARRAAAALPLIALAIVPATLVRPQFPYLQGLVLFGLVAAFMWADRIRSGAAVKAVLAVAVAGGAGAILAPRIADTHPWLDYRAWGSGPGVAHFDTFEWNQTYGPLHWPRSGRTVLEISARRPEYWKAQDLDYFDGLAWVGTPPPRQSAVPGLFPNGNPRLEPLPNSRLWAKWSQTLRVSVVGMQSVDVITAGVSSAPAVRSAGGVSQGADPGSWIAARTLRPGSSYTVVSYSPHPTPTQLRNDRGRYPAPRLRSYLTLAIPNASDPQGTAATVLFAPFHVHRHPVNMMIQPVDAKLALRGSPYARAYRLARRLAERAATPYAYVEAVKRYLSTANGFRYNEHAKLSRWPLESFLFSTRRGYCQQFSGAMALLLRMGGVPARVATGFTPGTFDSTTHRWVVTDVDAHAWVEVWYPRYGWVRVDPTPANAPALAQTRAASVAAAGAVTPENQRIAALQHHGLGVTSTGAAPAARRHATATGPVADWLIGLALGLLALVVAAAGLLRAVAARRDPVSELELAWARTRRPLPGGATLAGIERRLRTAPDAAAYVRALRLERYGASDARPTIAQRRALRRELARGLGAMGAMRALWALPPGLNRPRRER